MHQSAPFWLEIPDRLDGLEHPTPLSRCPEAESSHRHGDFQSPALPTELPGQAGRVPMPWHVSGVKNDRPARRAAAAAWGSAHAERSVAGPAQGDHAAVRLERLLLALLGLRDQHAMHLVHVLVGDAAGDLDRLAVALLQD